MSRLAARAKGQATRICACAFSAALLLEPISCSRSDPMQQSSQKPPEKYWTPAAAQTSAALAVPKRVEKPAQDPISIIRSSEDAAKAAPEVFKYLKGSAPAEQKKEVFGEFAKKFGELALREQVFNFLRTDHCPKADKYKVMDLFTERHGTNALLHIYYYAQMDLGTDFITKTKDLPSEHPETLSYVQSLAYGISKFGARGFLLADSIIETMDRFRIFKLPVVSNEENPMSEMVAIMAVGKLAKDNKINRDASISHIAEKYLLLKEDASKLKLPAEFAALRGQGEGFDVHTKSAAINLIMSIDQYNTPNGGKNALEKLLENPRLDPAAKGLIEETLKQR